MKDNSERTITEAAADEKAAEGAKQGKKGAGLKPVYIVLYSVFFALILIFAVIFVVFNSKLNKITYESGIKVAETLSNDREDDDIEAIASAEPPEGDIFTDSNVINVLLLGSDTRPYERELNERGRADCIMLCSLNISTGEVNLISFERGIMVEVPDRGYDLLTHSFRWGGGELTQNIVSQDFLLDVAGYVQVDFYEFEKIIDAIGGVDITLTQLESDALNGYVYTNAVTHTEVHEGLNHLDGYDTLQYCRERFIDSDWERIVRQRNTIQAVLDATKDLSVSELNNLADLVLPMIHTNLTKQQIASLVFHAPKFFGAEAGQMTVPYHIDGDPNIYCDFSIEAQRVRDMLYGEEAAE